ncbi:MAG: hypothetical protein ABSE47_13435 [Acidimicrobiales bacterium]
MRSLRVKFGLAAVTAVAAVVPLALTAQPARADYSPNTSDVVGVGSDTLQYMLDFMADGDAYGDPGYNQLGNKHKLVNIDATADANARLAYGVDGGQSAQTTCSPGTGSTAGTGNATGTNTGIPCVLNPTVVLRAGLQPVQRPNGSGAGFKALVQDMVAGHNTPASEVINFARASATQTTTATFPAGVNLDQLSIATDTLPMLTSSGANPTHAVPLSPSQLSIIYAANTGSCITWSDPRISGVWLETAVTNGTTTVTFPSTDPQPTAANDGWVVQGTGIPTGDTVASVGTNSITLSVAATGSGSGNVGLVNPAASTNAIIPLIPQVGSGTRSFFLGQLVPTLSAPGTCAQVSEENDPTAIYDVASGLSLDPKDAIEPMSQGRLDVYQGVNNTGTSGGIGGYFLDPSCAYLSGAAACGTGSVSGGTWATNAVTPAVASVKTGTPVGLGAYTGTGQGGGLFNPTRTLYMYFRNSDITSTTGWQPGSTENWLNTLFYDPCEVGQTCTGPGGIYGPAGAPYIQQGAGQTLLEDAGVNPLATEVCTDLTTSTSC